MKETSLTSGTIDRSLGLEATTAAVPSPRPLALGVAPGTAYAAGPRLGVVDDCTFPSFIVDDDERGGIVFGKHQRYRYGTKVKHKRLAGRIRGGRYKVKGKFSDKPAMKFLTGPKPMREDGANSFVGPAGPTHVGIWADLPRDCYQLGSEQQREDG
jgi:hypothetical protein